MRRHLASGGGVVTARFERVAIVGTGLIGASLAGAGRARGLFGHTVGVGRWLANLETARARGLVDEVTTDVVAALEGADLIVLATPVATAVSQLADVLRHASGTAVVTDVGSVKAPIVAEASRLGAGRRFVGAHPLAGKAQAGSAAADVDLFRDRIVVLTPSSETISVVLESMKTLWEALDADVRILDAAEHDEVLAASSHLPQMVAYALAAAADQSGLRRRVIELAAGGFRDTTRLATSDAEMWLDIVRLNRAALLDAMEEFSAVWNALRDAVAEGDESAFRRLVAAAQKLRGEVGRS